MEIDISKPVRSISEEYVKDISRRIRKNRLEYEISNEPKHLEEFYHNMFLPYIRHRHSDEALLSPFRSIAQIFSKGGLVLIKRNSLILGGGLYEYTGESVKFRRLGIREAKWEYVQYGVIGALYYFLIIEMQKRGYKTIGIGGSRPLLSDGVTKYKIALGARIVPNSNSDCLRFALLKDLPALRECLANNPLIHYREDGKPYCAFFSEANNHEHLQKQVKRVLRRSFYDSIAGIDLFIWGGPKSIAEYQKCFGEKIVSAKDAHELLL